MKRSAKKFSLILVALLCAVVTVVATATGAFATATEIVEQKARNEAEKFTAIRDAVQLEYTNRYNTYIEALKTNPSAVMKNRAGTATNWNLNSNLADLVSGGYLPGGVTVGNYTVTTNATNPKHLDVTRTTLPTVGGIETAVAELISHYNAYVTFNGTRAVLLVALPAATSDASHFLRSDMPNQVAYNTVTGTGCTLEWVGGGGVIRGLGDLTTNKLTESTAGAGITVGSNMNLGAYKLTATQLEATSALRTATLQTTGNATVAGTLGVTGNTTLANVTVGGTSTFGNAVTMNANITATGRTLTIGTINGVAVTLTAPNDTTNALTVSNGVMNLAGADRITTGGTAGTTDAQANTGVLVDGRLRVRNLSVYKDGKYQDMTKLLDDAGGSGVGAEGGTLDVKTLRVNRIVFYDNADYQVDAKGVYTVKDAALAKDASNARLEYANDSTGDQRIEYKIGGTYIPGSYYKNFDGAIVTQPITPVSMTPNFKYGNTPEAMDARPQTAGGTMRIDIPDKVNAMRVQLWGQAGGGYSDAVFPVTKGETYFIFAGLGVLKAPDSWSVASRLATTAPARESSLGADGVAGHLHPVNHAIMFVGNGGGGGGGCHVEYLNGYGVAPDEYSYNGGYGGVGGGYYGSNGSAYGGGIGGIGGNYNSGAGLYSCGKRGNGIGYTSTSLSVYTTFYGGGNGAGTSWWGSIQGNNASNGGNGTDKNAGSGGGGGGGGYYSGYGGVNAWVAPGGGGGSGYVNMAPFYPQPNVATVHNTTTTLAGKSYFPKTLNVTLMPELANKQSHLVRQETNIIRPNYPLTDALGGSSATMDQGYCRISLYENYTFNSNVLKSIGTKLGSRLTYSGVAVSASDTFYLEGYKLQPIAIPIGTKRMRVMLRGGGNTYSEGIVEATEYDNGKYYAYVNPGVVTPSGTGTAAVFYVGSNELTLSDLGECKAKTCTTAQNTAWLKRIKDFNSLRVAVANAPKNGVWGPNCYDYGFTGIYNPNDDATCFTAYNGYDRTFGHGTWNASAKRIVPVATEGTNGWGFVSGHAYSALYQGKKFYNTIVTSYFPEGTANTVYVEFFN